MLIRIQSVFFLIVHLVFHIGITFKYIWREMSLTVMIKVNPNTNVFI